MKYILLTLTICFFLTLSAHAQAVPGCPDGFVCITPAAAKAALEAGDKAKALQAEIVAKDQAISDLKDLLHKSQENYAECRGELTTLHQDRVEWMAEKELLFKLVRPKKFGVINF
jgi:hypothetical protein